MSRARAIAGALLPLVSLQAAAGPPFLTDDPETPGPHRWEIIVSGIAERMDEATTYELPHVDVNYGVGDRLQMKLEGGWVVIDERDGVGSGVGQNVAGVKWRFLDEERAGISVSTYPQAGIAPWARFAPHHARDDSGWFLPIDAERTILGWSIVGEMGRLVTFGAPDASLAGTVIGHGVGRGDVGVECHWLREDGERSEVLVDVGFHAPFADALMLLASAGNRVSSAGPDAVAFLGLSLEL